MKEKVINRICQTLMLPLYALIHDSMVQALKGARVSRQVALAVLNEIPKLPLSSKEQDELRNAKGAIELEDSFGSGNFFVIDAGSSEAFICMDKKNAEYLNQLLESHSDQDFLPAAKPEPSLNIQTQSLQIQAATEAQSQVQQNQTQDQDLLIKLQLLELLTKGNEQKGKRGVVKIGQKNDQNGQNLLRQILMLEILRGSDASDILQNLQMMQLAEHLSQSGKGQQNRQNQQEQQKNQEQQDHPQQGQDLLKMLQELQMMKVLQEKS